EERIRRHLHALEEQARYPGPPAKRALAADHVDLMAAQRERVGELGRDHAAAADRRVADHADVHGTCFSTPDRPTGSRTTMPSAKATPARAPNCASRLSTSCANVDAVRRVATAPSSAGANWLR